MLATSYDATWETTPFAPMPRKYTVPLALTVTPDVYVFHVELSRLYSFFTELPLKTAVTVTSRLVAAVMSAATESTLGADTPTAEVTLSFNAPDSQTRSAQFPLVVPLPTSV